MVSLLSGFGIVIWYVLHARISKRLCRKYMYEIVSVNNYIAFTKCEIEWKHYKIWLPFNMSQRFNFDCGLLHVTPPVHQPIQSYRTYALLNVEWTFENECFKMNLVKRNVAFWYLWLCHLALLWIWLHTQPAYIFQRHLVCQAKRVKVKTTSNKWKLLHNRSHVYHVQNIMVHALQKNSHKENRE
jgi:hypothetical protein